MYISYKNSGVSFKFCLHPYTLTRCYCMIIITILYVCLYVGAYYLVYVTPPSTIWLTTELKQLLVKYEPKRPLCVVLAPFGEGAKFK